MAPTTVTRIRVSVREDLSFIHRYLKRLADENPDIKAFMTAAMINVNRAKQKKIEQEHDNL